MGTTNNRIASAASSCIPRHETPKKKPAKEQKFAESEFKLDLSELEYEKNERRDTDFISKINETQNTRNDETQTTLILEKVRVKKKSPQSNKRKIRMNKLNSVIQNARHFYNPDEFQLNKIKVAAIAAQQAACLNPVRTNALDPVQFK